MNDKITFRLKQSLSVAALTVAVIISTPSTANPFVKDPLTHELERQLHIKMRANAAILNDEQFIKDKAKYIRKLFLALKSEGFNDKQALELVKASLHEDSF
ncbi:hypothetical protein [Pseudoteredinibacter isoporae]|uniref:hypothetical protein n=1 Tax=Pseudoteredinibacter isoporae TaxID=570281 RepID=UPI003101C32B